MKPKVDAPATPEPTTKEIENTLIEEIGKLIDEGDETMSKRRGMLSWEYPSGKVQTLQGRMSTLVQRLQVQLDPDNAQFNRWDVKAAVARINETHRTTGTMPTSWCRPAMFLLWVGYVPALCTWGGLVRPHENTIHAIDAKRPWFGSRGERSFTPNTLTDEATPVDVFRSQLEDILASPRFEMVPLAEYTKEQIRLALQRDDTEWLRNALREGPPEDALELPARFNSVPQQFNASERNGGAKAADDAA